MPIDPNAPITITAYDWVPDFAKGQVRDLRVRWALEEVEQNYAVRPLAQGHQKQPAHRALQPFGQVPTYEEGDLTLFESGAIVWHIAERFPGLVPEGPGGRAKSLEWLFAALSTVEPPILDYAIATLFEAGEPWSAPRLPSVEARIAERLEEAAARLGDADWFTGSFSAGDLMMVSVLRIVEEPGLLAPYPNLVAYVARGTERPAFRQALGDQMAGFTGNPPPGFDEWMADLQASKGDGGKEIRKNSAQRAGSNPDHMPRFSENSVRYDCILSLSPVALTALRWPRCICAGRLKRLTCLSFSFRPSSLCSRSELRRRRQ